MRSKHIATDVDDDDNGNGGGSTSHASDDDTDAEDDDPTDVDEDEKQQQQGLVVVPALLQDGRMTQLRWPLVPFAIPPRASLGLFVGMAPAEGTTFLLALTS